MFWARDGMEDFFLPVWITVIIASGAGAWVYAVIRPYTDSVWKAVSTIIAGSLMGSFLTFGVCEYMNWKSIHQHNAVAFAIGLLGIIFARGAVSMAESEATTIIGAALRRFLGVPPKESKDDNGSGKPPAPKA